MRLLWLLPQYVNLILGATATKHLTGPLLQSLEQFLTRLAFFCPCVFIPGLLDHSYTLRCQLYSCFSLSHRRSVKLSHRIAAKEKKKRCIQHCQASFIMPAPICAAFSVIPYASYHKSGLLRKDFSDRDFHPYLTYVFWGKGLSTMLFPLFFFSFSFFFFPMQSINLTVMQQF